MEEEIFDKGKRGIVYLRDYNGKKIIVKKKNPNSEANNRIELEADFLKKLNKYDIGPKFIFFENNELGMEFIEGELFTDYISKADKKTILKLIKDIFMQMYVLDKLKITKEEMHHPYRHIIIRKGKPTLIDFERCRYMQNPKNVSQFAQCVSGKITTELFLKKNINVNKDRLITKVIDYKNKMNKANLCKIIKEIA